MRQICMFYYYDYNFQNERLSEMGQKKHRVTVHVTRISLRLVIARR